MTFPQGSVPVAVAAKVYGKTPTWIRAGIVAGWLPIGKAIKDGKVVTEEEYFKAGCGRVDFYISPKRLWIDTGYLWKGTKDG